MPCMHRACNALTAIFQFPSITKLTLDPLYKIYGLSVARPCPKYSQAE